MNETIQDDETFMSSHSGFPDLEPFRLILTRVPFYNDEPKIFQYLAELQRAEDGEQPIRGFGSDLVKRSAAWKAAYEAVERSCLIVNDALPAIRCSMDGAPQQFVDPRKFQPFVAAQLKSDAFRRMRFSEESQFAWTEGEDALTGKDVWLPAQLVFCPYDFKDEPIIRFPSSNGAACGSSIVEARCRAVLEVIERDTFMCWYLGTTPAYTLNLMNTRNSKLREIYAIYQRYRLELRVILLLSKWPFPVVLAVIIDHTGIGPGLIIGLKCHPDLITAAKGAVAEAQQMRPWLRDYIELHGFPNNLVGSDISDYWTRALFWSVPERHLQLNALWDSAATRELHELGLDVAGSETVNWNEVWDQICSATRQNEAELFVVDLSSQKCKEVDLSVARALIPQAHPVYEDERFPYLTSDSLTASLDSHGPRWWPQGKEPTYAFVPPHPFS